MRKSPIVMIRMREALMQVESSVGPEIVLDGRRFVNFAGSSYLGLSAHPRILNAGIEALRANGAGAHLARAQMLVTPGHARAERAGARFFGTEDAVIIGSGYMFGLMALAQSVGTRTTIFYDEHCHYALIDAIAATRLPTFPFRHCDENHLRECLVGQLRSGDTPLVVSDGLFALVGHIPPLAAYAEILAPYGGRLAIDESHSFGVLGETGRGAVEQHRLSSSQVLRGGSLAKAFGVCCGIIPCTAREAEIMRSSGIGRGSTAGMAAAAAMAAESLDLIAEHPGRLSALRTNIAYLKQHLRDLGIDAGSPLAPIVALRFLNLDRARTIHHALMAEGIFAYQLSYRGDDDGAVIRCAIFADHSTDQLDMLVGALERLDAASIAGMRN